MHGVETLSRLTRQHGGHARIAVAVTAMLLGSAVGVAIAAKPRPDSAYRVDGAGKRLTLDILHNQRQMNVILDCGTGKNRWTWYAFMKPVPIRPDGSFKATNVPTARGKGLIPPRVPAKIAAIQGRFTSTNLAVGKIRAVRAHGGCGTGYWNFRAKLHGHI